MICREEYKKEEEEKEDFVVRAVSNKNKHN